MSKQTENVEENLLTVKFDEPTGEPTCKIVFENNQNGVYYSGQSVVGCVHLSINEETTVRGMHSNGMFHVLLFR